MNLRDIEKAIREFIKTYNMAPEVIFLKPETATELISKWSFLLDSSEMLEGAELVTLFRLKIQYSKDFEGVGLVKEIKNIIGGDDRNGRR